MKTEYDFSKSERGRFFRKNTRLILPTYKEKPNWTGPDGPIGEFLLEEARKTLDAYRVQPKLVTEHANQEHDTAHGGYAHRQLFELIQNSADALIDAPDGSSILVRLTGRFLYCADNGNPIGPSGVEGLMFAHMSNKRDTGAIGRFGLGFKSVLGVSDSPEFYSRTGSFRFDRGRAAARIAEIATSERYPILRLPEPLDPHAEMEKDEDLLELADWATNIVRLPLKVGRGESLAKQVRDFPPEFLLFVDHVRYLSLDAGEHSRNFTLQDRGGELYLDTDSGSARWRRFETKHCLSENARSDRRSLDDSGGVPIWWAVPLDRLTHPGQFWAFFPTMTASLVAGILNAPWKTNEDRQNLLRGSYNEELIEAAASMIADALPKLTTNDDPARYLDALPRRQEAGDTEQTNLLREHLFAVLREREIVPDQDGIRRACGDISYPPRDLISGRQIDTKPFERWAAYPGRPSNWLHHKALTRNRLAAIDRLFPPRWPGDVAQTAPRTAIAEWLEALVEGRGGDDAIQASMAAIQTAALVARDTRSNANSLGKIVLTAGRDWRAADPGRIFLPDEPPSAGVDVNPGSYVHPELASDRETLSALKELGLEPLSPEKRFRLAVERVFRGTGDDLYHKFWAISRELPVQTANIVVRERKNWNQRELWPMKLRVRTQARTWQPLHSVLLPGDIVPGDGSRDEEVTVDTGFHEQDEEFLGVLGIVSAPNRKCALSHEECFDSFLSDCRHKFINRDLPKKPHWDKLNFISTIGCGPLQLLSVLSDEGRARYTDALLSLENAYEPWIMRHDTQHIYPELLCEAPTVRMLRKEGRVRTTAGDIVPFADALGPNPKSPDAFHALLVHPMADKIKEIFGLAEPTPEFVGEGDPIPLTDIWPGLEQHLPTHRRTCRLVRCERILIIGQPQGCVFHAPDIYLADTIGDDEQCKLRVVAEKLGLSLVPEQIQAILQRRTPAEIEKRRAAIRRFSTDAERLLAAVGEQKLSIALPSSLLAVLKSDDVTLTGTEIAEAAIATYHTDALKKYKWALDDLDPPSRWAGSARAVRFVRSLGFSPEWAGERERKRDPFVEVKGPYSLPELHGYQRTIVGQVRDMLRNDRVSGADRRGMISMPTGSGKTRVAVQAIVEAMCDDDFRGGVLWIADRDELCEQAVEAWRQVWLSIGAQAARLRISRMWGGLERPQPTSERHVIVATIQTLKARLSNQGSEYAFLADFELIVIDEAHRSLAPTFTSVMQEVGLTRFQKTDEPFLLGLTATPYRGHDEYETTRLVSRYGRVRLDSGAFESDDSQAVIQELQEMGVLAQADHETIEGETFSFDRDELARVLEAFAQDSSLPWLPQSVEDRIAGSAERTRRIVEAYETHVDPDWPALVFATSVEHSRTVAALLNRRGIRSRAVSGETETATRRRVVEGFRCGEVKALVNYGVFREGFDAPRTRAIIVARPVYSPNLYFQMIGRGLRGPRNGGDERCLVINVQDNIENFDRKLAFSDLDWLWA